MNIPQEGIDFIITEESGGRAYYEKIIKKTFEWPGGASGVTGMAYLDLGYYKVQEIDKIFGPLVTAEELQRIQGARGLTGAKARAYLPKVKDITFEWDIVIETFGSYILPKFEKLTAAVFPGAEDLCDNARTALVSLVFNRGTDLRGDRRKEMRAIKDLIPEKDYAGIASQFRSMKRIWAGGADPGLVGRREREAKLVESCS